MADTRQKYIPVVKDGMIKGTWRLEYKLKNSLKVEGFGGRNLAEYPDPVTGKTRKLVDVNGRVKLGYWIDKLKIDFDPSNNPQHKLDLDFLIGHPFVGLQINEIGQSNVDASYFARKDDNPDITLVNLDYEVVTDLKEEDFIDKLVGKISLDSGVNSISLEKLRWILSHFGLGYREDSVTSNKGIEKQKLKRRLKTYVRSSYINAQKVEKLLEDLSMAKYKYEIKEMLRLNILTINGGMYLYKGNGLGVSDDSVITLFQNDPEFYAALSQKLDEEFNK